LERVLSGERGVEHQTAMARNRQGIYPRKGCGTSPHFLEVGSREHGIGETMSDQTTYTLEQARAAAEQKLDDAWLRYRNFLVHGITYSNGYSISNLKDELESAIDGLCRIQQVIQETEVQIVKMLENAKIHKS
jgi:hypothetical protein